MYKSPIEMLITDIEHQIVKQQDEEIYKAVCHYVPNVDKKELIRALQYDRQQYDIGYADGKRDAMAELVRCKDCRMLCRNPSMAKHCTWHGTQVEDDDFCSYGERREGE